MAIQLGTVAPVGFEDFADPQWLECMKEMGCTTVQMYRSRAGNDLGHRGEITVRQMQEYVWQSGLMCDSLHGLYGNDIDPSNPDESLRRAAVRTFQVEGELATQLGGPLVVVHCSGIGATHATGDELAIRTRQLSRSIDELRQHGLAHGIRYAFENLPPYHHIGADVGQLADLLGEAGDDTVGMCFDVAHANLAGDPIAATRRAGKKIIYVHACDNLGKTDDHLMPFTGEIDYLAFAHALRDIEYDGVVMLETFYKLDELKALLDQGITEKLAQFLQIASGEKPA